MKVLPLIGLKSLDAQRCFSALVLGLKMLPAYAHLSYSEYLEDFSKKPEGEKESLLRQAVEFVELDPREVESTVSFCADSNGIPYESTNIKSLPFKELTEIIVSVCMEVGRIKTPLVTEDEKKKSVTSPLTYGEPLQSFPN